MYIPCEKLQLQVNQVLNNQKYCLKLFGKQKVQRKRKKNDFF